MSRDGWFIGVIVWLCGATALPASDPPKVGPLLIFLPSRVEVVSLNITGHDFVSARETFAQRLFDSRDLNHDQLLDASEAARLALWSSDIRQLRPLGRAWKTADRSPTDGMLSLSEWRTFLVEQLGPLLRIAIDRRQARRAETLFALVDADHNFQLSPEELIASKTAMMRCDFDDDELISESELSELRSPQDYAANDEMPTAPFLMIDGPAAIDRAVWEITTRYGGEPSVPLKHIAGLDPSSDLDSNHALSEAELRAGLGRPSIGSELVISFTDHREGVRWIDEAGQSRSTRRSERVPLNELSFEVKYQNHLLLEQVQREELTTQFATADGDDNDYLSASEFAEFASVLDAELAPDAAIADSDGNQQITRDEITQLIEIRNLAIRCQLQFTVQRDAKSLFAALDQNSDRRVSEWEIATCPDRILSLDLNGDRQLGLTEMPGKLSLLIGLASPQAPEPMAAAPPRTTGPKRTSISQGPSWFQRMDRNSDKTVSWREFLGSHEQFESLDDNRDGIIMPSEAARIPLN